MLDIATLDEGEQAAAVQLQCPGVGFEGGGEPTQRMVGGAQTLPCPSMPYITAQCRLEGSDGLLMPPQLQQQKRCPA